MTNRCREFIIPGFLYTYDDRKQDREEKGNVKTLEKLKNDIKDSDMVLVGIGEEFELDWKAMEHTAPFDTWLNEIQEKEEAQWLLPYFKAYYTKIFRDEKIEKAYEVLSELLKDKNYFLVSLCTDDILPKLSWKENRVVLPCGGYTKLQCAGCPGELIDAETLTAQVIAECKLHGGNLEKVKKPVCGQCSGVLSFNNIYTENYDESGYLPMWEIYMKWLQGTLNRKVCLVELGVGLKFPSVIRWPFEKTAFFNQKAVLYRVHSRLYQMSEELKGKGFSIEENPVEFLFHMD